MAFFPRKLLDFKISPLLPQLLFSTSRDALGASLFLYLSVILTC